MNGGGEVVREFCPYLKRFWNLSNPLHADDQGPYGIVAPKVAGSSPVGHPLFCRQNAGSARPIRSRLLQPGGGRSFGRAASGVLLLETRRRAGNGARLGTLVCV